MKFVDVKKYIAVFFIILTQKAFSYNYFYWENPVVISESKSNAVFPSSDFENSVSASIWQDVYKTDDSKGTYYLSGEFYSNGTFIQKNHFAGPFSYSGDIPDANSVAVSKNGTIVATVLSDVSTISIFTSRDGGNSFSEYKIENFKDTLVAPRIYKTSKGGFIIFVCQGKEESFSVLTAKSQDGLSWTGFSSFSPTQNLTRAFVPMLAPVSGSDMVVFQSLYDTGSRTSYQLYSTVSHDGGATWSNPILFTQYKDPENDQPFSNFHNQRPNIKEIDGKIHVVWERNTLSSENAQIYYATLDRQGKLEGIPYAVSSQAVGCKTPLLIDYNNDVLLTWFDSRSGSDTIYLAQKNGIMWDEKKLSKTSHDARFCHPVIIENALNIYWQQTLSNGNSNLVRLSPDKTVKQGSFNAVSFKMGQHSTGEKAVIDVVVPNDSSGIDSFSYVWSQNKEENPPKEYMKLASENRLSLNATEDGEWYLHVRVVDYAGNWSDVFTCLYYRDNTPPSRPAVIPPDFDENGYLSSNTFTLQWNASPEDDTAGYTYSLQYMSPPVGSLPENVFTFPDDETLLKLGFVKVLNEDGSYSIMNVPSSDENDIEGKGNYRVERALNSAVAKAKRLKEQEKEDDENRGKDIPEIWKFGVLDKEFLQSKGSLYSYSPDRPPARLMTSGTEASFSNKDNGLYAFSVSSIDMVGNISEPTVYWIMLNKYIPYTIVTSVDYKTDPSGNILLSLIGRGFATGGRITAIYIDKDGVAPYDKIIRENDFTVSSDRRISNVKINDLEEGVYRIGLLHNNRGLYMTKPIIAVNEYGTVKFGDFSNEYNPFWEKAVSSLRAVRFSDVLLWCFIVFTVIGIVCSVRGISNTTKDIVLVKNEVKALLTGDIMPSEKKKKATEIKGKGLSLKYKLVLFTTVLVILVIGLISVPLGYLMITTQEQTLAKGLEDRVSVLLESLGSGVRAYMPKHDVLELGYIPQQSEGVKEALYATVIGLPEDSSNVNLDFVWATNDKNITDKIDTEELNFGTSRYKADIVSIISDECKSLNEKAAGFANELSQNINDLTQEAISIVFNTDAASVRRREEIQVITQQLTQKLSNELNLLSKEGVNSYPKYDSSILDRSTTNYIFYKPVLYRQGTEQNYVRGVVLVEIETSSLIKSVDAATANLIKILTVVAALALASGIFGSLVMASIIVQPVKKLAIHVAMIRDTDDKEKLEGHDIKLKSRDEIGVLGDTVNEMTHGLIKAAAAAKDLTVGKEVQKMFIPLEVDAAGKKLTTGSCKEDAIEFFGYYEGAKGVSGDYFDYKKLDNRHYAIIKCDVAGKGVPASLIMVEVATLFLNYFKDWKYERNGYKLNIIVSQINDLIESRGFKGRFAAFSLCIYDSVTGDLYFCNAGDNMLHIYRADKKKKETLIIQETPSAGVFPSFMVEMKGGFKIVKQHLNPGDVLFMYTDGIEEAKRKFRDKNFNNIVCAEPGLKPEETHETHTVGQESEEMGPERVNSIIETIFNRGVYRLIKWHNPIENELLEFDFSDCDGSVEYCITGLVSVEKIFRMYRYPKATERNMVMVDRKIDAFLNLHFRQYADYCSNKKPHNEMAEYMWYTHICEDAQYDDLTLLGLRRM